MLIRISCLLPAPTPVVWKYVKHSATFRYVVFGMLGIANPKSLPRKLRMGKSFALRLRPLAIIPGWTHHIEITCIDEGRYTLQTKEHGGIFSRWNHTIQLRPEGEGATEYTDQVEFTALFGEKLLAPLLKLFFWYRQRRWRALVYRRQPRRGSWKT
jgi:ligand-binding SRPBCC domain-containing protein